MIETSYADFQDLPRIAELCRMSIDELGLSEFANIDDDRLISSIIFNWASAPCIILKKEGNIIGFYGLTTYRPFYSEETVLGDYMLYIVPEHRSYKAAKALSKAAAKFADEKKINLDLNFITNRPAAAKARFLENMGAKITGVKGVYYGKQ